MTITADITPLEFSSIESGKQNFYILKNDRPFDIGDTIILHEKDNEGNYTGKEQQFEITFIIGDHVGLKKEYRTIGWYKQKQP